MSSSETSKLKSKRRRKSSYHKKNDNFYNRANFQMTLFIYLQIDSQQRSQLDEPFGEVLDSGFTNKSWKITLDESRR